MYNNESKIVASFKETKGYLKESGKYSDATEKQQSITIQAPRYEFATRTLNLGYAFIENALNLDDKGKSRKPKPPRGSLQRWLRTDEGKVFQVWNKASDHQKIAVQLEKMASDIGCELVSFEIMK